MKYKFLSGLLIFVCLVFVFWSLLPQPPLLQKIAFSTAVIDKQQHLMRLSLSADEKYRLYTPLAKIPPQLIQASLLQEDRYFYHHPGLNPYSLVKAFWQTYILKSRRMGASTISMQVARLRFHLNTKNWWGKLKQILLTLELEKYYSKDEILEAYFNLAPYGGNIEGVGAASFIYFSQSVTNLQLPQCLSLSIIPQNPRKRTPIHKNLIHIRNRLFTRWLEEHPEDQRYQSQLELPIHMTSVHDLPHVAPHFVTDLLASNKGRGLIQTTIDTQVQQLSERLLAHYLQRNANHGVHNAAILIVDTRDMGIRAAIGSGDFYNANISGQINGLQIKRSPGSTLKPFIYALAFDQGLIYPATVLKDVPHHFGAYNPENFDYDFMGPISAKDALILSRNIPAIYLTSQLKKPNLFDLLVRAHVSQLKPESYYGLSLSLGGAELNIEELTTLYAMLANGGMWQPLRKIASEIPQPKQRLLSPEASYLVLDILKDTPHPLLISRHEDRPWYWKTGTSSGFRDAWTIGIVGPYVISVWIGNFNNKGNPSFIGKNIAAPLFFELASAIKLEKTDLIPWLTHPEQLNLIKTPVCKASGLLPTPFCQDQTLTWFIPGVSSIKTDNIYREVAINPKNGLRTCHIDQNTEFKIYEFWPSDLLEIFKQAGIERKTPPVAEASCQLASTRGFGPQIVSPQTELKYIINGQVREPLHIPFQAVTDADVQYLYWFLNNNLITKAKANEPYIWLAQPGSYNLRAVDDHGRTDSIHLTVNVNGS